MSKQMLELADRLAGSLQPFDFLTREERDLVVSVLRCSAVSADETRIPLADHDEIGRKVLNQPWAIQSAVVTIAAHCTVIKDKCEDGDLSAISDLAGCISNDLLELANFLAGTEPQAALSCDQCQEPMGGPHHPECYRFTEPQTVASPADEMRRTAATACKNCRHRGSHLAWRCDACGFEVEHSQAVSAEESGK